MEIFKDWYIQYCFQQYTLQKEILIGIKNRGGFYIQIHHSLPSLDLSFPMRYKFTHLYSKQITEIAIKSIPPVSLEIMFTILFIDVFIKNKTSKSNL